MTANEENLVYISKVIGKPIISIYNNVEQTTYHYIVDEFKPAMPSNYIFENSLKGRRLDSILLGVQGFSHGNLQVDQISILTKVEILNQVRFTFTTDFPWIKYESVG